MENSIKITDFKIVKETEKAILLEIENKTFWFPKSKINVSDDSIEMEKTFFDDTTKKEVKEAQVQVFLLPEDYSEKVYKLNVPIEIGTYKTEKFVFVPKSKVTEIKSDSVIFPKWIWDKSLEEILNKEVEYYNKTYEEQITTNDYDINTDVVEL